MHNPDIRSRIKACCGGGVGGCLQTLSGERVHNFHEILKGDLSPPKLKTTVMEASAVPLVDLGQTGIIYTQSLSFF